MNIYGAREKRIKGISSNLIKNELIKMGHNNCSIVKKDNLLKKLKDFSYSNEIIITMGAGDLWKKGDEIIKWLSQ